MYHIPYFKAENSQAIEDFLHQNWLATLCLQGPNGFPLATHVPIVWQNNGVEECWFHLMRKQEHTEVLLAQPVTKALLIVQGEHAYITAENYQKPQSASTVNYKAIHAQVQVEPLSTEQLVEQLRQLTNRFEKPESEAHFSKLSDEYIANMTKALVGFKATVIQLDHVFKQSQNKTAEERSNIRETLTQQGFTSAQIQALVVPS
ncbi:MAG: FMN-binding negative transcriptional regulator [Bacteroidetes bacterium]|nr:MAG: FMN-binding negative transcriptional regulator [Bacteroidota bacterium]